jgi:hypothetical protein
MPPQPARPALLEAPLLAPRFAWAAAKRAFTRRVTTAGRARRGASRRWQTRAPWRAACLAPWASFRGPGLRCAKLAQLGPFAEAGPSAAWARRSCAPRAAILRKRERAPQRKRMPSRWRPCWASCPPFAHPARGAPTTPRRAPQRLPCALRAPRAALPTYRGFPRVSTAPWAPTTRFWALLTPHRAYPASWGHSTGLRARRRAPRSAPRALSAS